MTERNARLSDYRPWRDWVATEGQPIFPTNSSFEWFVRRHRRELVASGQFIVRQGPNGSLAGPRLADVVLKILQTRSQEAIQ